MAAIAGHVVAVGEDRLKAALDRLGRLAGAVAGVDRLREAKAHNADDEHRTDEVHEGRTKFHLGLLAFGFMEARPHEIVLTLSKGGVKNFFSR